MLPVLPSASRRPWNRVAPRRTQSRRSAPWSRVNGMRRTALVLSFTARTNSKPGRRWAGPVGFVMKLRRRAAPL